MSASEFENISNFRDVAESINGISHEHILKTGLFFRSARPDEATESDVQQLRETYHIKTIVDLRTTTEHINAAKKRTEAAVLVKPGVAPASNKVATEIVQIPGISYAEINLNGKGFERSLVWKLSYFSLAKVVLYMAMGYRMDAIGIIGREVLQPRGLIGLGIDTIEHSGPEIKQVFDLLAKPEPWPVLVHCTQGKDRTGLVIILVLLLCGVSIDAITADYVLSEEELKSELEERRKETSSIGLDDSFSKCPADFPTKINQFIEEKYGSIQDYLLGLGVTEAQIENVQSTVRRNTDN